ncbi:MAG TPA: hypothetical protein VGP37_08755, partial [Candidatus Nanopelagicales bacterium]|nr:hypothetical protein [Candidatus Nanopelagicales bacterium]
MTDVQTVIANARFVITCDAQDSVIESAAVAIDDGRIVAVGDVEDFEAETVIDASGCIVLPGFVNLHTHLP